MSDELWPELESGELVVWFDWIIEPDLVVDGEEEIEPNVVLLLEPAAEPVRVEDVDTVDDG